LQIDKDWIW